MREDMQAAIAELIGTFILIFFGCGSILIDQNLDGIFGLQGIAFAFGLIVMAVVYAIGHVSGAHINPAVTLALAAVNKFSWHKVPFYLIAQFLGATLAAFALSVSVATDDSLGMTMPSGDIGQALFLEVIMTAFLLFVVMGVGTDKRAPSTFTAIAVGGVVIVDVLVGGTISGASLNPARSFGPALVTMNFEHLWIYFVGPIAGALVGVMLYRCCAPAKKIEQ
jgi:MIP family channel proteins